jgi:hypothetical protein
MGKCNTVVQEYVHYRVLYVRPYIAHNLNDCRFNHLFRVCLLSFYLSTVAVLNMTIFSLCTKIHILRPPPPPPP